MPRSQEPGDTASLRSLSACAPAFQSPQLQPEGQALLWLWMEPQPQNLRGWVDLKPAWPRRMTSHRLGGVTEGFSERLSREYSNQTLREITPVQRRGVGGGTRPAPQGTQLGVPAALGTRDPGTHSSRWKGQAVITGGGGGGMPASRAVLGACSPSSPRKRAIHEERETQGTTGPQAPPTPPPS